jgi:hypothetical protein
METVIALAVLMLLPTMMMVMV